MSSSFTVTSTRDTPAKKKIVVVSEPSSTANTSTNTTTCSQHSGEPKLSSSSIASSSASSSSSSSTSTKVSSILTSFSKKSSELVRKDAGTQKLLSDQENQRRAQDQVRQWFSDYGSCAKFLVKTQLLEAKRNAAKEERKEREAAQAARMALIQREEQQQLQLQSPLTTPTLTSTKLEKMNNNMNNNSTIMQYQQQQHDTTSSTGVGGRLSPTGVDHSSIDPISPRESIYSSAASSAANLEYFNLDDELVEEAYQNNSLVVLSPSTSFNKKDAGSGDNVNEQRHELMFPSEPSNSSSTQSQNTNNNNNSNQRTTSAPSTTLKVNPLVSPLKNTTTTSFPQQQQIDIYEKIKKLKKQRLLQARIQTSIFTLKTLIRVAKDHDLKCNFRQKENMDTKSKLEQGWNTLIECLDDALEYDHNQIDINNNNNNNNNTTNNQHHSKNDDSSVDDDHEQHRHHQNNHQIITAATPQLSDIEFPDFLTIIDIMQGLGLFYPDLAPPVHGRRPDGIVEVHRRLLRQSLEEAEDFLEAFDQLHLYESGRIQNALDHEELLKQRRIPDPNIAVGELMMMQKQQEQEQQQQMLLFSPMRSMRNNNEDDDDNNKNDDDNDSNDKSSSSPPTSPNVLLPLQKHFIAKMGSRPCTPIASPVTSPERSIMKFSQLFSNSSSQNVNDDDAEKEKENNGERHFDCSSPITKDDDKNETSKTSPEHEHEQQIHHSTKKTAMINYCEEKFPLADPTDMGPEFVRKSREVRQMLKLHRLTLEKQKMNSSQKQQQQQQQS